MRLLQINTVYGKGSTGKIAQGIHDVCINQGIKCITAYRYAEKDMPTYSDTLTVSSWLDCHAHNRIARYTNLGGCFSKMYTAQFLKKVDRYKPDIIHLHNLHGNYIHVPSLFAYIKKHHIRTVWTLHDCWAMSGQCPHFTMVKCDKWKTGCHCCPQIRNTQGFHIDPTRWLWKQKKKWFTGIEDMTIVTPSQWLADLVKQSFLAEYPVCIINNGIDLSVFKPIQSDFRNKYGLQEKYILLGVAFGWGNRKGLDVFVELSGRLKEKYKIVLVGTDEHVDAQLPEDILSIHRTQNQQELAEIYSAADLFVNPTREENYPTVNMEAIACGTPVLTFDTGGSPEMLNEKTGSVVPCDDIEALEKEIRRICEGKVYKQADCVENAKDFAQNSRFKEYVRIYENHPCCTQCAI